MRSTEGGASQEVGAATPGRRGGLSVELARARAEQALFSDSETRVAVGRYVLVETLGRGGMGVVYAAYDPELDRKVAIKVLHASTAGQARLVREAQALARLKHPNVVAVYDVGTFDDAGAVFVAMEYVEGPTLTAWLDQRRRSWRELLPVLVQAARGLAAAHAAGLIHRDFKPDNVMIDAQSRVRVMDFGLARAGIAEPSTSDTVAPLPIDAALTATGALVGTPAFMAPEQFSAAEIDARSDQFSFCVAAWVALYGERPFKGDTPATLGAAVIEGRRETAPRAAGVPAWLHAVVSRGLAVDREQRWPGMDALVVALELGQARARRGRIARVAGGATACAGALLALHAWDAARRASECERQGIVAVAAWDGAARASTRAAILATGVVHAETTAERVMPWLDRHAEGLRNATTEACRRIELDGNWPAETAAVARWCLAERGLAFEALVHVLGEGDAGAVHRAVEAAAGLSDPSTCLQPAALARMPLPAEQDQSAVRDVQGQLARAAALRSAGRYVESLPLSRAAVAAADATGWTPVSAAARLQLGLELDRSGEFAEAERTLEEAYFEAVGASATEVAADAALSLTQLVGDQLERHVDGLRWARLAEREVAGERDDAPRTATLLDNKALVLDEAGDYDPALELAQEALRLREQAFGPRHPAVAASLAHLGVIYGSRGDYRQSAELAKRALALREEVFGSVHASVADSLSNVAVALFKEGAYAEAAETQIRAAEVLAQLFGPRHPDVGMMLGNAGGTLHEMGDNARAKVLLERSLEILEATYGPEHAIVGRRWAGLGNVRLHLGDHEGAAAAYRRSLEILQAAHGDPHIEVAMAQYNVANLDYELHAYPEARAGFLRALETMEAAVGPDHPQVGATLSALGNTYERLHEYDLARECHRRALAIQEKALGPDHPDLAYTLLGIASVTQASGRHAEALATAERALAIAEASRLTPREIARVRFSIAESLRALGRHERARIEAERARDLFTAENMPGEAAGVERWLAADPK